MSQGGPWSGRAFDQRAREAAREAAMAEGITLGEYLNRLLMSEEEPLPRQPQPQPMETPYSYTRRTAPPPQPQPQHHAPAYDPATALDRLTRRIEATEARSTLAINGIDHTVLGLVARLQNAEQTTAAVAGHVEGLIEEMRVTHEALQSKVRRMEQDDSGARNLEALKALEDALGKLASHVYDEGELTQNETAAIKGRVEAGFADMQERVDGMETRVDRTLSEAAARVERAVQQAELRAEGQTRQLADRLGNLETQVQERLARSDQAEARLSAVEADVSGALDSMEGTLVRIQERLNRAETSTDTALKSLEQTFAHLDERIEAVASTVDPELAGRLKQEFEQRFEDLTRSVRQAVDSARLEMASEIARAAEAQDARYAEDVGTLKTRLAEVEAQGPGNVTAAVQEEIGKLGATVAERIDALATHVEERIEESEIRNAEAIEQVGEQVTVAAVRLQKRQDEAISALAQDLDGMRQASDARLSDALAGVSERLERMQAQSSESLSPVQRAIAALATRLESLEAFTTPPDVPVPPPVMADEAPADLPGSPTMVEDIFTSAPEAAEPEEEFQAGFSGWEVIEDAEPESPYKADFDAIRAAASRISAAKAEAQAEQAAPPVHSYVADVPVDEDDLYAGFEEPAQETPAPQAAMAAAPAPLTEEEDDARGFDPVSELDGFEMLDDSLEHSHAETRESDIFDEEPDFAAVLAKTSTIPEDQETSDYIARARRAAMAAVEQTPRAKPAAQTPATSPKSGVSKLPLYLAATAVVATGAGVGGFLYLRGKQPPQPVIAGPVDTYVDPQTGTPAATQVAEVTPAADAEDVLFEDDAALAATELFGEATPAEAKPASILELAEAAATSAQQAPVEMAQLTSAAIDPVPVPAPEAAPSLKPKPVLAKPKADAKPKPELTPEQAAIQTIVTAATAIEAGNPAQSEREAPVRLAARADATFPRIPSIVSVEAEANAGNAIAQYQYAQVKMKEGDVETATSFLRRAAQKGIAPAQYDLGKLYERGNGVDRDLIEARGLIQKAAEAGHIGAMYDYALFLAEGEGGPKSEPDAVAWFAKAAEHGLLDAQYNLGVVHAEGIGTEKNLAEALFWFEVAAIGGDAGAKQEVTNLRARIPMSDAVDVSERARSWKASAPNGLANGKFGAQRWNTGNPLQVQAVQTALGRLGFDAGAPDGVVGPRTAEAIRDYQTMEGLTATGTITPELVDHLNARASGATT
ncbi:peptidoglycan-binding protein [Hyphomonas sp.]|uniref:peptidoglycan-binding protein n=1 Tax=Hyphomonas sp. TaxID=87 RepID=UPI00391BB468